MKTRLYIGQPMGPPVCLSFENLGAMQEWLNRRDQERENNMARCVSTELGADGTRTCYPPNGPHRFKLRLAASNSVDGHVQERTSCDNHIARFLAKDWVMTRKACSHCTTNECVKDEDICENCLDLATKPQSELQRNKSVMYCINRDNVHGCLVYAEVNEHYCTYCKVQNFIAPADRKDLSPASPPARPAALKPRVRLIGSSERPCKVTTGCAGTMSASVTRFSAGQKPELWWQCNVCRARMLGPKTWAIVDPDASPAQLEGLEASALLESLQESILDPVEEPVSADKASMSQDIRSNLGNGLGG